MDNELDKPCLVETGRGFSVLYKERLLYSKYNPSATILRNIATLSIKDETLILCCSPVLGYGLQALFDVAPKNCFILCVECDESLYEFSLEYIAESTKKIQRENFRYCLCKDKNSFARLFCSDKNLSQLGNFRRCVSIDFSGGTSLNQALYSDFVAIADDFISTFWKNRLTLIKMGRLYAKNLLANIAKLKTSPALKKSCVTKPILVIGAGLSADDIFDKIKSDAEKFFVVTVDASLVPALKHGIVPDCVVAVECQLANEKAFIGAVNKKVPIIADLTSRPHITELTGGTKSFFLSDYTDASFLTRIKRECKIDFSIPPLGSVGLAAMEIALCLRSENVPVFFCGLDFCYDAGKSHCKDAPALRMQLDSHNRFAPLGNPASGFRENTSRCIGKDQKFHVTDPAMTGYANLFSSRYAKIESVYDVGEIGVDLGAARATSEQMLDYAKKKIIGGNINDKKDFIFEKDARSRENAIDKFYKNEIAALKEIRAVLTGEKKIEDAENYLQEMLGSREYLFLHFPDAYKGLKLDQSFLKRIRVEIDFFLKTLENAK